jgi:dihydrofolate reductase
MNVLLNMAISPNGLIARDNGDEEWLPEEGWTEFVSEAQQLNNIVMGRETYEIVTRLYDEYNFDNVKVKYKVIITRNLTFKAPEGYIVLHSPEEAIDYIASKNIECLFLKTQVSQ